jgi:hypothetical protein
MNQLMGITRDKDVTEMDHATEEEVDSFEEGVIGDPKLEPMRPYLETVKHTLWNEVLSELFVEHFEEEQEVKLTTEDKTIVEKMFSDRLTRLSRLVQEFNKYSPQEREAMDRRRNLHGRRNTRRNEVSHRSDIWNSDILIIN